MTVRATDLDDLLAVAVATLQPDGTVVAANAGFRRLVAMTSGSASPANVAQYFVQPDFTALSRANEGADGEIHRGLMTVGDYAGMSRTLRGRVWRENGLLRVLAEYDVVGLEALNETMLELNRGGAEAQRGLAQALVTLKQREAQVVELSRSDPLTGVGNRLQLQDALAIEVSRADLTGAPLSALMIDIDHLTRVNDIYGRDAGDRVLKGLAAVLRRQTRPVDVVARYGDEEFVLLLPHTDTASASVVAERVRSVLATLLFDAIADPVTASFGVVTLEQGEQGDALLRRAHAALHRAKREGHNRVVTA